MPVRRRTWASRSSILFCASEGIDEVEEEDRPVPQLGQACASAMVTVIVVDIGSCGMVIRHEAAEALHNHSAPNLEKTVPDECPCRRVSRKKEKKRGCFAGEASSCFRFRPRKPSWA